MGCGDSKERKFEENIRRSTISKVSIIDPIESKEILMRFNEFTIDEINLAFFDIISNDVASKRQLDKCLKLLNLNNNTLELKELYTTFWNTFTYESNYHDISQILTALYTISRRSNQEQKALALYNLYDNDSNDNLREIQILTMIQRICECVFEYSANLLKIDNHQRENYIMDLRQQVDELGINALENFKKNNKEYTIFTSRTFADLIEYIQISKSIDLTCSKSIRANLMSFFTKRDTISISKVENKNKEQSIVNRANKSHSKIRNKLNKKLNHTNINDDIEISNLTESSLSTTNTSCISTKKHTRRISFNFINPDLIHTHKMIVTPTKKLENMAISPLSSSISYGRF